MAHQDELWKNDTDQLTIEIGKYPGRSSSKRGAASSTKGCCSRLSPRGRVLLARFIEFLFTAAATAITMTRVFKPPVPAYPLNGTGDHGALPFMIVASVLGIFSCSMGLVSAWPNWFDKVAEKGRKRRFFRYTSPYVDVIFIAIAGGAIYYAIKNLDDGGTQCFANMSTYQGCVVLLVAVVMTGLGAIMALLCIALEPLRIKEYKKTSRNV